MLWDVHFSAVLLQVITKASGFGRVGSMIGSWRSSVYQIDGMFAHDGIPRQCGLEDVDPYWVIAGSWAGL